MNKIIVVKREIIKNLCDLSSLLRTEKSIKKSINATKTLKKRFVQTLELSKDSIQNLFFFHLNKKNINSIKTFKILQTLELCKYNVQNFKKVDNNKLILSF